MPIHRLRAWALGLLGALLASTVPAQDALPEAVLEALHAAGLSADALAAAAVPLRHGERPWRHRAERAMQPGSTLKLLTSVVALDRLGPDHRGGTELRSAAALDGGALQGDLVLRGGGDVELGTAQLWALLVDLRQAGVRHIAGDLVLDRTRYRPARIDLGLPPFDEAPEFAYNVVPDALMLLQGLLPLELSATENAVVATTVPPLGGIEFDSRMALVDARCTDWDEHWRPASAVRVGESTRIVLSGAFPRGCTVRTRLQLVDRTELTERMFRSLWQGLGGSWSGRAREAGEATGEVASRVLARRSARPWGELLRHLNKTSDNAWTRLLYLELGVPDMAAHPERSTRELADAAVRRWLAARGIDDAGLVLDNGSGLSRSERISPWQLARALAAAYTGPHAPELLASLPVAGVDGGLRHRLKEGPATGWARLKTGSLRNVTALAGYVNDPCGRPWAVAMMINHDTLAHQGRTALDALVDHIARHGLHAAAPAVGPLGDGP